MITSFLPSSALAALAFLVGCATRPEDSAFLDYHHSVLKGEELVCVASCEQSTSADVLIFRTLKSRGIHAVGLSTGGKYTEVFVFEGRKKEARNILLDLGLPDVQVAALASERDILEIAMERPLEITVNGVPAKYGDPHLAAAVDALANIPHPWTVPTIIEAFDKETSAWLRKLQTQVDKKSDQMWQGWDSEYKRCGHLAMLLAASRDPRAAVVLGDAFDNIPEFPGRIRVVEGLYHYFLSDPQYRQLPPEKPEDRAYTSFYPEMTRQVKQWWTINKDLLKAPTKAQSK